MRELTLNEMEVISGSADAHTQTQTIVATAGLGFVLGQAARGAAIGSRAGLGGALIGAGIGLGVGVYQSWKDGNDYTDGTNY